MSARTVTAVQVVIYEGAGSRRLDAGTRAETSGRWLRKATRSTPSATAVPAADGVDENYLGKKQKFLTVVSNFETGEPLWFGTDRKREALDGFFNNQLASRQRRRIEAACVDM